MTRSKFHVGLWTSKNGRVQRICDMDDNHLRNSIAVLEGRGATPSSTMEERILGMNREQISEAQKNLEEEVRILREVEASLANVPPGTLAKYQELVDEREKRIAAKKWNPHPPKTGGGRTLFPRRR